MENYKIVCLIHVDQTNPGAGLPLAFGHDYNSRLNSFIEKHLYSYDSEGNFQTIFGRGAGKHKFISITEKGGEPSWSIFSDNWDILFVSDDYNTDIKNFPEALFDENTLLMYHTTPSIGDGPITQIEAKGGTKKIKKGKKGWHEYDKRGGYTRLYDLTEAWEQNEDGEYKFSEPKYKAAIKSIIDWFDLNAKLNAALDYLHECLGGEKVDTTTLKDVGFNLDSKVDGKPSLQELIKICENGFKITSLIDLRDSLLENALMEK